MFKVACPMWAVAFIGDCVTPSTHMHHEWCAAVHVPRVDVHTRQAHQGLHLPAGSSPVQSCSMKAVAGVQVQPRMRQQLADLRSQRDTRTRKHVANSTQARRAMAAAMHANAPRAPRQPPALVRPRRPRSARPAMTGTAAMAHLGPHLQLPRCAPPLPFEGAALQQAAAAGCRSSGVEADTRSTRSHRHLRRQSEMISDGASTCRSVNSRPHLALGSRSSCLRTRN
jgi:hypothetical protein